MGGLPPKEFTCTLQLPLMTGSVSGNIISIPRTPIRRGPTDAEKIHPDFENYNREILAAQSIKRRGTPEDVGHLVTFLAGDGASFITGQLIQIDGGWMMH